MRFYEKIDAFISIIENGVILLSYSVLIALIGFEALRRSVTGEQWLAGPEIALYAFVWLSWFAMSKNVHEDAHLSFSVYREKMGCKTRVFFEVVDCLIWLTIGAIIISTSVDVVQRHIAFNQTVFGTNVPLWLASIAVPVGWTFTMIRIGQRLHKILTKRSSIFSNHKLTNNSQVTL